MLCSVREERKHKLCRKIDALFSSEIMFVLFSKNRRKEKKVEKKRNSMRIQNDLKRKKKERKKIEILERKWNI